MTGVCVAEGWLELGVDAGEETEFWCPPAAMAYAGPDGGWAGFEGPL